MFHSRRPPDPEPQLTPWGFYAMPAAHPPRPFRVVAIAMVVTVLLMLGGCFVVVGRTMSQLGTGVGALPTLASEATTEVRTGQRFVLDGFRAARDWQLTKSAQGGPTITGLLVTNTDDQSRPQRWMFTFLHGQQWLTQVCCSCPTVAPGETATMQCVSTTARMPRGYDRVVVADGY